MNLIKHFVDSIFSFVRQLSKNILILMKFGWLGWFLWTILSLMFIHGEIWINVKQKIYFVFTLTLNPLSIQIINIYFLGIFQSDNKIEYLFSTL